MYDILFKGKFLSYGTLPSMLYRNLYFLFFRVNRNFFCSCQFFISDPLHIKMHVHVAAAHNECIRDVLIKEKGNKKKGCFCGSFMVTPQNS